MADSVQTLDNKLKMYYLQTMAYFNKKVLALLVLGSGLWGADPGEKVPAKIQYEFRGLGGDLIGSLDNAEPLTAKELYERANDLPIGCPDFKLINHGSVLGRNSEDTIQTDSGFVTLQVIKRSSQLFPIEEVKELIGLNPIAVVFESDRPNHLDFLGLTLIPEGYPVDTGNGYDQLSILFLTLAGKKCDTHNLFLKSNFLKGDLFDHTESNLNTFNKKLGSGDCKITLSLIEEIAGVTNPHDLYKIFLDAGLPVATIKPIGI